ncbi:MAG TPA: hypothetical protein VKF35_22205 [Hyphomicrobiaceae bacterium]|nr:hypothetical protein [Hyphomicrobiaceae bacterium]
MRRSMLAAVVAGMSASSFLCPGASAEWWYLPNGIDNPMPRYYDYRSPGVFYGNPGPVGFEASGPLAAPYAAAPTYGGYGYAAAVPPAAVVVPVRPICGVYRYWRDGVCRDRRGY